MKSQLGELAPLAASVESQGDLDRPIAGIGATLADGFDLSDLLGAGFAEPLRASLTGLQSEPSEADLEAAFRAALAAGPAGGLLNLDSLSPAACVRSSA